MPPTTAIDRVLETVLYVDDLDAAERFYGEVLGLELDSRQAGVFVFFRCGAGMLLLFEPGAAAGGRRVPPHGASGPGHACFAVPEDALDAWRARLLAAGVAIAIGAESMATLNAQRVVLSRPIRTHAQAMSAHDMATCAAAWMISPISGVIWPFL